MITKSTLINVHDEAHLRHWDNKEIEILRVLANPKDDITSPDAMPLLEAMLAGTD